MFHPPISVPSQDGFVHPPSMAVTRTAQQSSALPSGWRSIRARVGQLTTTFYISPAGRRFSSLQEATRHISATAMAASIRNMEASRSAHCL